MADPNRNWYFPKQKPADSTAKKKTKENTNKEKESQKTQRTHPRRPYHQRRKKNKNDTKIDPKSSLKNVNKEKVCSKIAEVLINMLEDGREESDWKFNEPHNESDDSESDSFTTSSISKLSEEDEMYAELSQMSMARGLSQTLSQSSKLFKSSHDEYMKIGLFWDIENCPIPKGKSALHFVKKLRDNFCEDYTEEKFIVVCNASNQPLTLSKELSDVMVRIEHVSPGKNAADEILRRNIREFTENKPPGTKVILITGDINFNSEIHEMRYKKHFKVVLIHNKQTSEALKMCANECISFEEFAGDIQKKEFIATPELVSVTVSNLPMNADIRRIKSRLCQIMDPSGGKVVDVNLPLKKALVNFSVESDAMRAICSLQNSDVYGSKIKLYLTNDFKEVKEKMEKEKKNVEEYNSDISTRSTHSTPPGIQRSTTHSTQHNSTPYTSPDSTPDNTAHSSPYSTPHSGGAIKKDQVGGLVSTPTCVTFCMDRKINLEMLEDILTEEVGAIENLSLVSSKGNKYCYTFMCRSLKTAKNSKKQLKLMTIIKLSDVHLVKTTVKNENEDKILDISYKENSQLLKFGSDLEAAKEYYLHQHEIKYEELKAKLDLFFTNNSTSSNNEFKTIYNRLRLLEIMKTEFLENYKKIVEKYANKDKFEAQKELLIECEYLSKAFPIYAYRSKIVTSVMQNQVTIISGNPGSGKSTQVVQYIYQILPNSSCRMVITQPHKKLAYLVRYKVATQSNDIAEVSVTGEVSPASYSDIKVLFVTDHFLLNECFKNVSLNGYSHIVVDEVQVNSPTTDMLLAYLKLVLEQRKDVKLIILTTSDMSKTITDYFKNSSIIEIDNKPHQINKMELKSSNDTYIITCVAKAIDIVFAEQNTSNILIYLPNIAAVEQASKLLDNELKNNSKVTVHKLLMDINFLVEYSKIQKSDNCCVILTTRDLLTTVCIKNIKFIIDSGVITNYIDGPCFKYEELVGYSSYEKIMCNEVVNLFQIKLTDQLSNNLKPIKKLTDSQVLTLVQFGIKPNSFKFLYEVAIEDIQASIKELEKMRAIKIDAQGYSITNKGSMILALPLDIHLASLLLDGIDSGIGYVTICFISVAATAQYHMSSCASNNINGKNLIELLKEFFQFGQGCEVKNISPKLIASCIVDIENALKCMNYQYDIKSKLKLPSDWLPKLEQLLTSSWKDNLCELRKPKGTYECKSSNKMINLLPYSDSRPRMIVFETLCKFYSGDYAINFIPIESDIAEESSTVNDKICIKPIGGYIMRTILSNNGKLKKEFEQKLNDINKSKVDGICRFLAGELIVFCNSEHKPEILEEIHNKIKSAQELMEKQLWPFTICDTSGLKIVWTKGAKVLKFLMPNEYLKIVMYVPPSVPISNIVAEFSKHGFILHYSEKLNLKENAKKQVFLMYNNPTSAMHAVSNRNIKFAARPVLKTIYPDPNPPFTIFKVSWTRRLNTGTAVINFDKYLSRDIVHPRITSGLSSTCFASAEVILEYSDKRIVLRKLNPNVSKFEIEEDIKKIFNGVNVKTIVVLPQEKIASSSNQMIKELEVQLKQLLTRVLGKSFDIMIKKPEDKDELWVANISCNNVNVKQDAVEQMMKLSLNNFKLFISQTKYCNLHYSNDLFAMHKNKFIADVKKQKSIVDSKKDFFKVSSDTASNGRIVIKCEASTVIDIILIYKSLCQKINGIKIDLSTYGSFADYLFYDEILLEEVAVYAKKRNSYIKYKKFANEIVVVGSLEAVNDIKEILRLKHDRISSAPTFSYSCNTKGMLCKLFETYGPNLKDLKTSLGAHHINLEIRTKTLIFYGGKEEEIKSVLNFVKSSKPSTTGKEKGTRISVQCPVCLENPLHQEKYYRFEHCGHIYCCPCVGGLVAFSQFSCCIAPGCNAPTVQRDLSSVQILHPLVLKDLASRATMDYIKLHKKELYFCPVPDCDGVFPRTTDFNQCLKCFNEICLKCDVIYHYGQSCNEFQKTQGTCSGSFTEQTPQHSLMQTSNTNLKTTREDVNPKQETASLKSVADSCNSLLLKSTESNQISNLKPKPDVTIDHIPLSKISLMNTEIKSASSMLLKDKLTDTLSPSNKLVDETLKYPQSKLIFDIPSKNHNDVSDKDQMHLESKFSSSELSSNLVKHQITSDAKANIPHLNQQLDNSTVLKPNVVSFLTTGTDIRKSTNSHDFVGFDKVPLSETGSGIPTSSVPGFMNNLGPVLVTPSAFTSQSVNSNTDSRNLNSPVNSVKREITIPSFSPTNSNDSVSSTVKVVLNHSSTGSFNNSGPVLVTPSAFSFDSAKNPTHISTANSFRDSSTNITSTSTIKPLMSLEFVNPNELKSNVGECVFTGSDVTRPVIGNQPTSLQRAFEKDSNLVFTTSSVSKSLKYPDSNLAKPSLFSSGGELSSGQSGRNLSDIKPLEKPISSISSGKELSPVVTSQSGGNLSEIKPLEKPISSSTSVCTMYSGNCDKMVSSTGVIGQSTGNLSEIKPLEKPISSISSGRELSPVVTSESGGNLSEIKPLEKPFSSSTSACTMSSRNSDRMVSSTGVIGQSTGNLSEIRSLISRFDSLNSPLQRSVHSPVDKPQSFPVQRHVNFVEQRPRNFPGQSPENSSNQRLGNSPVQRLENSPGQRLGNSLVQRPSTSAYGVPPGNVNTGVPRKTTPMGKRVEDKCGIM